MLTVLRAYLGRKETLAGIAVSLFGLSFLIGSLQYPIGTPARMNAGFFPLAVGAICSLIGLVLIIGGGKRIDNIPRVPWRPLIAVMVGMASFALLIERVGMVPAAFAAVLFAALGDRDNGLKTAIGLALLVPPAIWLIFSVFLGAPTPALRWSH